MLFFFNDTATTEIYTLSLHDALPISPTAGMTVLGMLQPRVVRAKAPRPCVKATSWPVALLTCSSNTATLGRSEEHTSELQSQSNLVCRLLLEKKNSVEPPHHLPTRTS